MGGKIPGELPPGKFEYIPTNRSLHTDAAFTFMNALLRRGASIGGRDYKSTGLEQVARDAFAAADAFMAEKRRREG